LSDDVVVRLRKVQILSDKGVEETAIAAYLVSDGIDQCRVGFLQRHLVPHAKNYDGVLAQITEVTEVIVRAPANEKRIIIVVSVVLLQSSRTFHQHQQVLLHHPLLRTLIWLQRPNAAATTMLKMKPKNEVVWQERPRKTRMCQWHRCLLVPWVTAAMYRERRKPQMLVMQKL
jgi:hypothetical protein